MLQALVALAPSAAEAQTSPPRVRIVEAGVYAAESVATTRRTSGGEPVFEVRNIALLERTTTIPARLNIRFGVRYSLSGIAKGSTVDLRMVTRFPESGVYDPGSKGTLLSQEYRIPRSIGSTGYRDFTLGESWEIAPGIWTFEFWIGDRKVGEQQFCLYDPDAEKTANGCAPPVS